MRTLLKPAALALALTMGGASAAHAQIGFQGSAPAAQGGQALPEEGVKIDPPGFSTGAGGATLGFIPMLLAFVMMGIMLGVNLMPCKRGHQD
jgi:hypothetical protein